MERQRQKRRMENLMHPKEPKAKSPPPPCGGDCEDNCPYDGQCRYPTWEEDWAANHGKRKWEAIKSDTEKLEHAREIHRKAMRKYNRKMRFIKKGGSPAEFEKLWAEAGGDPEEYKKLLERKGDRKQWT